MTSDERPIQVGDRFETTDGRDAGRVVEVTRDLGLLRSARDHIARIEEKGHTESSADHIERVRSRKTYFYVKTEAHPRNPDAVGNVSRVSERTLRKKYKRVSR
jgi:hypothetical protein